MDALCTVIPGPPGTLRLAGELDISGLSRMIETLDGLEPHADIELDLTDLTFMDSAGVYVLVYAAKLVEPAGRLVLVGPTRQSSAFWTSAASCRRHATSRSSIPPGSGIRGPETGRTNQS